MPSDCKHSQTTSDDYWSCLKGHSNPDCYPGPCSDDTRLGNICPKCNLGFGSSEELISHWKDIHKLPTFFLQAANCGAPHLDICNLLYGELAEVRIDVQKSIVKGFRILPPQVGLLSDIYSRIASEVNDVPLGSVTRDQRNDIKTALFGIAYGTGPNIPSLDELYQRALHNNYKVTTA